MSDQVLDNIDIQESPMLAFTDLLIGLVFLLLIVISTLSITYRSQLKDDERVVGSEDSLLKNLSSIRESLKQSNYREQQLTTDLLQLEQQVKQVEQNNQSIKQQLSDAEQKQLQLEQHKQLLEDKLLKVNNNRLVPVKLLNELRAKFKQQHIPVSIDDKNGILHFADSLLFSTGSAELSDTGEKLLNKIAKIFSQILPCYSETERQLPCAQVEQKQIEAIFIEGHTDNQPYDSNSYDNWLLSMNRARNTYKYLLSVSDKLGQLKNKSEQPIFSLSAYGETRPIAPNDTKRGRAKNRRIDFRLISFGYKLQ